MPDIDNDNSVLDPDDDLGWTKPDAVESAKLSRARKKRIRANLVHWAAYYARAGQLDAALEMDEAIRRLDNGWRSPHDPVTITVVSDDTAQPIKKRGRPKKLTLLEQALQDRDAARKKAS